MRNQETTKHDYGHALLVAGAYGRMGCAILSARAALRSGCGLLTVHLPSPCVDPIQTALPEAMVSIDSGKADTWATVPDHLERYNAIAVGPGIGTAEATADALHGLLTAVSQSHRPFTPSHSPSLPFTPSHSPSLPITPSHSPSLPLTPSHSPSLPFTPSHSPSLPFTPLVLDADALNILALHPEWLPLAAGAVITPHAREYERLFGDADPAQAAREHNLTIVKKSHRTRVYAPDGQIFENQTGNAGMATAGSGDVLTGIMLGMLSSNILHADLFKIVCRAVEIHGKSGDIAIEHQSESSLIASDLVDNLRYVSTDISTD